VRLVSSLAPVLALFACGDVAVEPTASALATPSRAFDFVLVDFSFDQPAYDLPTACPAGLNLNERDYLVAELAERDPAAAEAFPPGFNFIIEDRKRGGVDPCADPGHYEVYDHLTFQGTAPSPGFDLDGHASTPTERGPKSCPHEDFSDPSGRAGIDNQLWRVLGCIEGYQPGATIDEFAITNIRDGARTILVRIRGVDDPRDDPEIEVGLFSGEDAIPLDVSGEWLAGASLGAIEDTRYHNWLPGRIEDGVVTAGPGDILLDFDGQFLDSEYPLRGAQLALEFAPDGSLQGTIGGYWDFERFYDTYARQATRLGAFTVGFRCPAMYQALREYADGYPDPESGACTAISTTFRMVGIPAFVILPEPDRAPALAAIP
jgi:hypothetical protein